MDGKEMFLQFLQFVKLQKLEGCWRIKRREVEGDRNGGNVGKDPEYIVYLVVCMCMLDGGSQW